MRRAMLAALGVIALALASPGAALAHHRGHHHKAKAKAHHARVHFEHFGASASVSPPPSAGTTSSDSSSEPAPSATSEDAGKILSFEKEVLTLALNDGSTVSGKVTNATEIECVSASGEPSAEQASVDDKGSGDDQNHEGDDNPQGSGEPTQSSGDDEQSSGDDEQSSGDDEQFSRDDQQSSGENQQSSGDDQQQTSDKEDTDDSNATSTAVSEPPCDTGALTPETVVREAELRVEPNGAEWKSVELVR